MSTYTPIASANTQSGVSSITFANLPQNYQSLRIIINGRGVSGSGYSQIALRYNNDTATNYSRVAMFGGGSGTGSTNKGSNETNFAQGFMTDPSSAIGLNIIEIHNYTTPNANKIAIGRWGYGNSGANLAQISVGLYRSTSPITSITIYNAEPTALSTGTTINIYGFESGGPKAFGGDTVITDGTYYYHAFRRSGTFTPTQAITADVLVVAGGGGAGANISGGGGAGGLRLLANQTISSSTTVTIGAGGTSGPISYSPLPTNGNNTSFGSLSVTGGGVGGGQGNNGGNGGSGGGVRAQTAGTGNAGGYTPPEGYNGALNSNTVHGGGGGGSGGAAAAGGGTGGAGSNTYNSISFGSWLSATGTGVGGFIAGGGGGSRAFSTDTYAGGSGGGGTGAADNTAGGNGVISTGSGGGGGGYVNPTGGVGGAGGSGIVIIRYAV